MVSVSVDTPMVCAASLRYSIAGAVEVGSELMLETEVEEGFLGG